MARNKTMNPCRHGDCISAKPWTCPHAIEIGYRRMGNQIKEVYFITPGHPGFSHTLNRGGLVFESGMRDIIRIAHDINVLRLRIKNSNGRVAR